MSPPTTAYASMPSELVTCGQNFSGPPTWSSGTWAKDHSPNAQHATEMAASDQASVGAARVRIRPPARRIVSDRGRGCDPRRRRWRAAPPGDRDYERHQVLAEHEDDEDQPG